MFICFPCTPFPTSQAPSIKDMGNNDFLLQFVLWFINDHVSCSFGSLITHS